MFGTVSHPRETYSSASRFEQSSLGSIGVLVLKHMSSAEVPLGLLVCVEECLSDIGREVCNVS